MTTESFNKKIVDGTGLFNVIRMKVVYQYKWYVIWVAVTVFFVHVALYGHFKYELDVAEESPLKYTQIGNVNPIIGMIAMEVRPNSSLRFLGTSKIRSMYVKFLEHSGARVVPIRNGMPESYYDELLGWVNGIFLPGGHSSFVSNMTARSAELVFQKALQLNQRGDFFPVWGTCWGFQMILDQVAGEDLKRVSGVQNITLPLDFTPEYKQSRMFGPAPKEIIENLSTQPYAQHNHNYSIFSEDFYNNTRLTNFFKVLTTNVDEDGYEFISTVEAREYPIYGIQWHPEKPLFFWHPFQVVLHGDDLVKIGHYMADFFVNEARKNAHKFPDLQTLAEHLIWNNHYRFRHAKLPEFFFIDPVGNCTTDCPE